MTIEALQQELKDQQALQGDKDNVITNLEDAHSDKSNEIENHLSNIEVLKAKLEAAEELGLIKDAAIQDHMNARNDKCNVIENKEGDIIYNLKLCISQIWEFF